MAIEKFEVGKYYRYTGKTRQSNWNFDGHMDFVLDGQPRRCVKISSRSSADAGFYGENNGPRGCWVWADGFENWEEVTDKKRNPRTPKKRTYTLEY